MLIITKPTIFASDGMAVRGQCNHDTSGWRLMWFNSGEPTSLVWQGSYRNCRRLQGNCLKARTADEARALVDRLLNSTNHQSSQNTEVLSAQTVVEELDSQARRKKKRKRHA